MLYTPYNPVTYPQKGIQVNTSRLNDPSYVNSLQQVKSSTPKSQPPKISISGNIKYAPVPVWNPNYKN